MQKNITLSAEEELIARAREKAQRNNSTLNAEFRQWLERYIGRERVVAEYDGLMQELEYVDPGEHFDRDQLNER